jgi:hypothetical protein
MLLSKVISYTITLCLISTCFLILHLSATICEIWPLYFTYSVYLVLSLKPGVTGRSSVRRPVRGLTASGALVALFKALGCGRLTLLDIFPCDTSFLSWVNLSHSSPCLNVHQKWDWVISSVFAWVITLVALGDHCCCNFLVTLGDCRHLDGLEQPRSVGMSWWLFAATPGVIVRGSWP